MQSFSRGWSFLKQAWQMAVKDRDLIKPSIYSLIVGFIVSIVFIVPLVGAGFLFGAESTVGNVVMFIIGAAMIFAQYSVGYIFSAMTVYLIFGFLAEGDGRMDKAWAVVKRDWLDILSLAGASTVVNLISSAVRGKNRNSGVRNFLAGTINVVWTEAAFLLLPAMVIEDINLKDALKRIYHIIKNNLLLVGISTIGVKAVNGLIGFLLGAVGIGLGFGVGLGIVSLAGTEQVFGWVAGISLGVIIAGTFIMVATVVTSYTATAYHTCLYLWAREAEKAQESGQPIQVEAPAPLRAVLGD
ncbi:MAG: hypothetical protein JXB85_17125 [Anaerolineales bacterium]|nr:hypothetical protein [Anaerolineales bacterium]